MRKPGNSKLVAKGGKIGVEVSLVEGPLPLNVRFPNVLTYGCGDLIFVVIKQQPALEEQEITLTHEQAQSLANEINRRLAG